MKQGTVLVYVLAVLVMIYLIVTTAIMWTQMDVKHTHDDEPVRESNWDPKAVIRHVPVNIRTQGHIGPFSLLGIVNNENGDTMPLYGRREHPGSTKWEYYLVDNSRNRNRIPLEFDDEVYDGDTLPVPIYDGTFTVTKYDYNELRYIPWLG